MTNNEVRKQEEPGSYVHTLTRMGEPVLMVLATVLFGTGVVGAFIGSVRSGIDLMLMGITCFLGSLLIRAEMKVRSGEGSKSLARLLAALTIIVTVVSFVIVLLLPA